MKNLDQEIQNFLITLDNKGYSALTKRNYRFYLSHFSKWLMGKPITAEIIGYYRFHLSAIGLSKPSQNNYLIALRSFLSFMDKQGKPIISKDRIELAKVPEREINFLTSSQIKRMLNQVRMVKQDKKKRRTRFKERAILEMLFSCGLRVSELCNLNRDQINIKRGEFTIIGKGGRRRLVFLSKDASYWLKKYLKTRRDRFSPLFITPLKGKRKGNRINMQVVQNIVRKYARKAHIPMRVTPHMFRHAYASDLLRNGANLRLVQELLGHKNISTTQIYTHLSNPELKEGYLKYHSGSLSQDATV